MSDHDSRRLILLRHATTTHHDRTKIPPENPPLDADAGANHDYKALADALPQDLHCIISPLERCVDTAKNLQKHGAKFASVKYDERLVEQSYGQWHGKKFADIEKQHLDDKPKHSWHRLHPDITPPDGENFGALTARMRPVIDELIATPGDHILITHAMVIRACLGIALNLPSTQAVAFHFENLSISKLNYRDAPDAVGNWYVEYLNRAY